MKLVVTPFQTLFVAKITGVDLGRPIDEATQRAIERAMDTYAVCVLPGQHLEDEEQIAFSRLYGPLEVSKGIARKSGAACRKRRIAYSEIFDISNLDENGGIRAEQDARSSLLQVTELWHTDLSFRQGSAKWSMLHAKVIPPAGGDTEFADTRAAYDALPDAMKRRLEGLSPSIPYGTRRPSAAGTCRRRRNEGRIRRRDMSWCGSIPTRGAARSTLPRTQSTSSACGSRRDRRCSAS